MVHCFLVVSEGTATPPLMLQHVNDWGLQAAVFRQSRGMARLACLGNVTLEATQ